MLHRWIGLGIAAFLALAGVTGAVIAFQDELDAALNPSLFVDPAGADRQPMRITELVAAVEIQLPHAEIFHVPVRHQAGVARVLGVGARIDANTGKRHELAFNDVFASPVDGRVLGTREWGALRVDRSHLIPFIYKLHMSLHLPGRWGTWIMGGVALAWFLDCFVGFYLTLPATRAVTRGKTFWQKWKPAWQIKRSGGAYRASLDLHRAAGLYFWMVLAAVSVSGIYFNLREEVFNPVLALVSPVSPNPTDSLPRPAKRSAAVAIDYDAALSAALRQLPAQSRELSASGVSFLPDLRLYRVTFDHADRATAWFRVRFLQVFIDADTGQARAFHGTDTGTVGDIIAASQFPLHSGQILGLPGRILICVSGLLVAVLSGTGVVIWWKKRSARQE